MKRFLCVALTLIMLLGLCGCSKTSVKADQDVTLNFVFDGRDFHVTLTAEEAETVIDILDGNIYDPIASGVPSCGFDKDISLTVGSQSYAIARDTCSTIQDLGNLRYFNVTQEENDYIHALFEKYGGLFPCI